MTTIDIDKCERMYTTNPCQPFFDGTISPETVHPRAKNPLIAGFFREIGRADRLGSGIRNLYKYCKDYGGEDPVFTEGNDFIISVSLKKLDAIRFPFEKPSIDVEKASIGSGSVLVEPEKVHIGSQEVHIEPEKVHIQSQLMALKLSQPTVSHILQLLESYGFTEVFGRTEICKTTGLKERGASKLIGVLLSNGVLDIVTGQGKGKYRFRDFANPVNPVNPV